MRNKMLPKQLQYLKQQISQNQNRHPDPPSKNTIFPATPRRQFEQFLIISINLNTFLKIQTHRFLNEKSS
ncbi:hypothetical protein CDL12_14523 [Handroanthus impetiginosus]|uniref:Uncharacterized protein n=1 Tax=Handroanthus impetiginosus TaxID=429701 RepID=A0A2G9GR82_9LAMI|nr:hypothetical protein CDL12_19653 [Handroanthus impetiginosus]PIN12870.1 hypothetical protein CDL12_14523 [Handroanthus impetiginosus]